MKLRQHSRHLKLTPVIHTFVEIKKKVRVNNIITTSLSKSLETTFTWIIIYLFIVLVVLCQSILTIFY